MYDAVTMISGAPCWHFVFKTRIYLDNTVNNKMAHKKHPKLPNITKSFRRKLGRMKLDNPTTITLMTNTPIQKAAGKQSKIETPKRLDVTAKRA